MKKIYIFLLLIALGATSFSQTDGRLGVTVGVTNYITDTNLLFSKSGTGFSIGVTGDLMESERVNLFISLIYSRHTSKFVGKEDVLSPQEDIPFSLDQISLPLVFNFNFLVIDDFKVGVFAGPSFNFLYDWTINDGSREDYFLEPLMLEPRFLRFDVETEEISFNVFGSVGLSAQYSDIILLQLKYDRSITDPYRRAPVFSQFVDISGTDSIISFSATYFW